MRTKDPLHHSLCLLKVLIFSLCCCLPCIVQGSLRTLYSTLDPLSVREHFAFFELYPDSEEGKEALSHAWELLQGGCRECSPNIALPSIDITPLLSLVQRGPSQDLPTLTKEDISLLEKISAPLHNKKLASHTATSLEEFLSYPIEETDVARGLLLADLGSSPEAFAKIQSYEAILDLMALQIFAKLPCNATAEQKIAAISDCIFSDMRFRFPPHSLYAKDIDLYTLLPSVLDQRKGVCLGVSILYLSIAQRLDLPLEAITPPGHIFVRYPTPEEPINIETTARGIDIPSKRYLNLETKSLQTRTMREVIGLAFMNQASVSWHKKDFSSAIALYEKASLFLPKDDFLLQLFLGMNYLFAGQEAKGKALLQQIVGKIPSYSIVTDTVAEDYLLGRADPIAIQTAFLEVDETRDSILEKQKKLEEVLAKFPKFRQGIFHLAITHLQLGREKEAIPLLEQYAALDPNSPTAHYYLAALHFQRKNYPKSRIFLEKAEALTRAHDHHPPALQELRSALEKVYPCSSLS